jgi:hypothetical protein
VQRLADLLGHKIDVRSRLDAGSVFTIEVPPDGPNWLRCSKLKEAQESTPSRGTVLIIEDDRPCPKRCNCFDAEGHRTVVAADWHKALELAVQQSPVPDLSHR